MSEPQTDVTTATPMTLQEHAEWIKRSADRLVTFCSMKQPILSVIESERHLLLRKLIDFPVDTAAQAMHLAVRTAAHQSEQHHLITTGFYDEVLRDIDGLGGDESSSERGAA